jgi:hypothetical protein
LKLPPQETVSQRTPNCPEHLGASLLEMKIVFVLWIFNTAFLTSSVLFFFIPQQTLLKNAVLHHTGAVMCVAGIGIFFLSIFACFIKKRRSFAFSASWILIVFYIFLSLIRPVF